MIITIEISRFVKNWNLPRFDRQKTAELSLEHSQPSALAALVSPLRLAGLTISGPGPASRGRIGNSGQEKKERIEQSSLGRIEQGGSTSQPPHFLFPL